MSLPKQKIVIIGGGNGTGMLISSLKNDFDITAIVSMADDGGSTGRLRKEVGASALGDIRQCLVAFTDSEHSKKLFSYRFGEGDLEGHSLGNLFLSAAEKSTGSLYMAINQAKHVLGIKNAGIIPVTDDKPDLVMTYEDKDIRGVYKIANTEINGKNADFRLEPTGSKLSKKAEESIREADLIIIAPGNFYCSIIPALIVDGMSDALSAAEARKVFVNNLVNFNNHTKGFNTNDYLSEIHRLAKSEFIDIMVANNNYDIYGGEEPVRLGKREPKNIKVLSENLVSAEKSVADPNDKIAQIRSKVRHDKATLNKIITQILRS